ncbi:MAG TPA: NYN domain-containing protein [Solirubrobacterales bacterium]|nr:NYN domain-containing protein [Solirubrobacterales bacterium]
MRTIVYVDGFNLYYGACRAPGRKWLDVGALCERLLPHEEIVKFAYCTANLRRDPRDPELQDRQRLYHRALEAIPHLEIHRGRFLEKRVKGSLVDATLGEQPRRTVTTFEEKGTDVNIASLMLMDGFEDRYEHAVLISNDGDLKMPVEIVSARLNLPVTVVNPVLRRRGKRRNKALSPEPLPPNASFIQLRARHIEESQFPAEMRSEQGALLAKPPGW